MNKRQAKKHKQYIRLQKQHTIRGIIPESWSDIRWAKQIRSGKLRIKGMKI